MKKVFSIFMLLGVFVFVSSCQKENLKTESNNQIENEFKDEEDDPILGNVPTVHGQIIITPTQRASGIEITFEGLTVSYYSSTEPDINGNFTFYNVVAGTYLRKTYVGGSLTETVTYVVQ